VTRWHGWLFVVDDAALSREKNGHGGAALGRQPSRRPEGLLPPPTTDLDEKAPDLGEVASKGASALAGG
jgi:hypothetical protein